MITALTIGAITYTALGDRSTGFPLKILRPLFLILALLLISGIIYTLGPSRIWSQFQVVGSKIFWVFIVGFPRYLLYTIGWSLFLPAGYYSLGKLFQIKVAGELITRSTPIHFLGGDAARVFLMGRRLSREAQAGSVIMDRTIMTFGAAVVILFGLIIATFRLPLPLLPEIALWILVGLLFAGLLFIISHQKKNAFTSLLGVLEKIGFRRWIRPHWREKIALLDKTIRGHYDQGHQKVIFGTLILFVARLTVAFEIFLFMKFLGIPLNFLDACVLSSLALLLTVVFFLFPGNLGILEGTYGLLFHWLGLDPASGVALELLRKINAGLWYFVGAGIALIFKREK